MNDLSNQNSLKLRIGGRNLYLVGMMGCGKSHTGPLLANKLGYSFVDMDKLIEKVSGITIQKIFETEGENSFRDVETKVLNVIGQRHSLVVATGGGVVIRSENWGILHQGIVIWIDPGRDKILARLRSDAVTRPLLETNDPIGVFDELMTAREPFYSEADMHVLVGEEAPEEVSLKIMASLPTILRDPYPGLEG